MAPSRHSSCQSNLQCCAVLGSAVLARCDLFLTRQLHLREFESIIALARRACAANIRSTRRSSILHSLTPSVGRDSQGRWKFISAPCAMAAIGQAQYH